MIGDFHQGRLWIFQLNENRDGFVFTDNRLKDLVLNIEDSKKEIIFIIGGAYGFSDKLLKRANEKISLSKMTFSHQMIRLFFCEQLYRAFTIINNHPYHNN